mmetsp:Transcript_25833/g.84998  ORF Transcript_25833/g.84998 Transcript_25833/m.84998 type:complete len:372 (+) Transcript_25833:1315-2430(+)
MELFEQHRHVLIRKVRGPSSLVEHEKPTVIVCKEKVLHPFLETFLPALLPQPPFVHPVQHDDGVMVRVARRDRNRQWCKLAPHVPSECERETQAMFHLLSLALSRRSRLFAFAQQFFLLALLLLLLFDELLRHSRLVQTLRLSLGLKPLSLPLLRLFRFDFFCSPLSILSNFALALLLSEACEELARQPSSHVALDKHNARAKRLFTSRLEQVEHSFLLYEHFGLSEDPTRLSQPHLGHDLLQQCARLAPAGAASQAQDAIETPHKLFERKPHSVASLANLDRLEDTAVEKLAAHLLAVKSVWHFRLRRLDATDVVWVRSVEHGHELRELRLESLAHSLHSFTASTATSAARLRRSKKIAFVERGLNVRRA